MNELQTDIHKHLVKSLEVHIKQKLTSADAKVIVLAFEDFIISKGYKKKDTEHGLDPLGYDFMEDLKKI